MQTTFQRNRVLLLHASFWWVYLSFFVYQITSFRRNEHDLAGAVLQALTLTGFNMLIAYLNYFVFLPRFIKHKNIWRYAIEFLPAFILVITARVHLLRYQIDGYTHKEEYFYSTTMIVNTVATTLFIVIFVAMLRFAKDWFELEARKNEVENEKLTAELNFLKAQINPHFLFNTLNNLYYLAFTQSPNTTEVIAKLSQMMRYMIYDSNHDLVPVTKEIEYMQSYISLERLRLNNAVPIKFDVTGGVEGIRIVPLIFITFLENAFKHGVSNSKPDAWVNISIRMEGKNCQYIVENSKLPVNADVKSGIGLQNVQRRLELSYPGKHELSITESPEKYSVQLNLVLS